MYKLFEVILVRILLMNNILLKVNLNIFFYKTKIMRIHNI